MGPNIFLALICLILAGSPFVTQIPFVNDSFQLRSVGNIRGSFQVFVITIGAGGFLFALFNMFLKKKNGSPYLALGTLVLLVEFFWNDEQFPLPLGNAFLGGELFFCFLVGLVLAIAGLIIEWLVQQPHKGF